MPTITVAPSIILQAEDASLRVMPARTTMREIPARLTLRKLGERHTIHEV